MILRLFSDTEASQDCFRLLHDDDDDEKCDEQDNKAQGTYSCPIITY